MTILGSLRPTRFGPFPPRSFLQPLPEDVRIAPPMSSKPVLYKIARVTVLATAVLVMAHGQAFAAAGGGIMANGIGSHMEAGSADLEGGGGYVLDLLCYIFAAAAAIAAGYTFWQHHKNPNSQHRLAYSIGSLVVAGFFATMPSWVGFSSQTASGQAATVTGTSQQLTFNGGTGGG